MALPVAGPGAAVARVEYGQRGAGGGHGAWWRTEGLWEAWGMNAWSGVVVQGSEV